MERLLLFVLGLMGLPLVIATCNYEEQMIPKEESFQIVRVTTYMPVRKQTDSTPYITASGFKLNHKNPKKHRIVAVSRDIKRKLKFGNKVKLIGIGKYSGIYVVEDVMNKRFKNRVDILINPTDDPTMFKQVKMIIL